jgi:hypothetical protein
MSNARFISIIETAKNSRIWILSFTYDLCLGDGNVEEVFYQIELKGNNANLDGSYSFDNGYKLDFDLKGNGKNIKTFNVSK